jgi:TPR repeat protein
MRRARLLYLLVLLLTSQRVEGQNVVFLLDELPSIGILEGVSSESAKLFEQAQAESSEAVESLAEKLILKKNSDGHFLLGWAAEHPPQGVRPDLVKARLHYREGASAEHAACQVNLAAILMRGSATHPEAGDLLTKALHDKSGWAGFYLGIHKLADEANTAGAADAVALWENAGKAGSKLALRHLGMLREGLPGFPELKDLGLAAEAYRKAVALDDDEAKVRLGVLLVKDPSLKLQDENPERLFEEVRSLGETQAKFLLAQFLGDRGSTADARMIYVHLAEVVAHAPSMMKLALFEADGSPTAFPEESLLWYRRAAKCNYAPAHHQLGMHATASGDQKAAFQHFLSAGLGQYAPSARQIAECYRKGIGTPADMYSAGAWMVRAVEAGDSDAMVDLAEMMLSGEGVPFNDQLLDQLCQRGLMAGNPRAALLYGMLHERGVGREPDKVTALAYYEMARGRGLDAASPLVEKIRGMLTERELEAADQRLAELMK